MSTNELERQLTGCVLAVLRGRAYAPPSTRDPAIREPYFDGMVQALMERIKADGWLIMPPTSRWPDDEESGATQLSAATPRVPSI